MSIFSEGLIAALGVLADAKAESLQYATVAGGAFTALTGFVIHQDPVQEPVYDENSRATMQTRRAFCKGPLTPLMAIGYQVKDLKQTAPYIWAVEGVTIEEQQIITLTRQERVLFSGPDRGASA